MREIGFENFKPNEFLQSPSEMTNAVSDFFASQKRNTKQTYLSQSKGRTRSGKTDSGLDKPTDVVLRAPFTVTEKILFGHTGCDLD